MIDPNTIKDAVESSYAAFQQISEQDWAYKPKPEKWSKKEILGHLIDSANTNLRRFVMTQYKEKENIIYLQDEWVVSQAYQEAGADELTQLWRLLNLQIVRTVEQIPKDKLSNQCDTGRGQQELHTLEFLVDDYLVHMQHHLKQIIATDQ